MRDGDGLPPLLIFRNFDSFGGETGGMPHYERRPNQLAASSPRHTTIKKAALSDKNLKNE